MSDTRLTNVLITGANQGLGLETVRILSQLPFYHVYLCARNAEAGGKALADVNNTKHDSSKVELLLLDVDNDESIEEIAKKVPVLDILVNNAGINGMYDTIVSVRTTQLTSHSVLLAMDDTDTKGERKILKQIYETNVISVAIVTMAFMPALKASISKSTPRPSILMISSTLGSIGHMTDPSYPLYNADLLAYNSSKTALSGIARYFAKIFPEARVGECCSSLSTPSRF